jgi:hypothetical protein
MPAFKFASTATVADPRIADIVETVQTYPLAKSPYWKPLAGLSSHTEFDGIEVDPAGVAIADDRFDRFDGLMNVYVGLEFASKGSKPLISSDAFVGTFKGHFSPAGKPEIDAITIDTAPFYED